MDLVGEAIGRTGLKVPRPSFVGRDSELKKLRELVLGRAARIVTVLGPPGAGKSRLANEFVATVGDEFPGGIRQLDLAAAVDAEAAINALNGVIGEIAVAAGDRQFLKDPHEGAALLVIHNCGAVVGPVSELLGTVVTGSVNLRVLVTCREPLRLYEEHTLRLEPLPLPSSCRSVEEISEYAVIRLFIESTRRVNPRFTLTVDNMPEVLEIVTLLDGLPLAVELAASRLKLFGPSALLNRIRLGNDLSNDLADTPLWQRSLRATMQWSFRLLTEDQARVLAAMSVCADDFDLPAVENIAGISTHSAERALETLVDKSLVMVRGHCHEGEPRFGMLNIVRTYARLLLGTPESTETARSRHAAYIVALLANRIGSPDRPSSSQYAGAGISSFDDCQAAFEYLLGVGDVSSAARLAIGAARNISVIDRYREIYQWLRRCVLSGRVAGDRLATGTAYSAGVLAAVLGHREDARTYLNKAGEDYRRRLGAKWEVALVHFWLGHNAFAAGNPAVARAEYANSVLAARGARSWRGEVVGLAAAAGCALIDGELEAASQRLVEVAALLRRHGDHRHAAAADAWRSLVALRRGLRTEARRLCRTAVHALLRVGHRPGLAFCLELAVILGAEEGPETGRRLVRLAGAAAGIRTATGAVLPVSPEQELRESMVLLREKLGAEVVDAEFAAGWLLSTEAIGAEAAGVLAAAPDPKVLDVPAATEANLTRREWEVALLVSQGHTNRQIAKELGIAEWTAVNHVRRVMRKLDVKSRVHIAHWVILGGSDNASTSAKGLAATS